MTPSWNPKHMGVPKSNESGALDVFLMLFVQIFPENSLECGGRPKYPEDSRLDKAITRIMPSAGHPTEPLALH